MRHIARASILALATLAACQAEQLTGSVSQHNDIAESYGVEILAAGNTDDWRPSFCVPSDGICRMAGNASGSTITGFDASYYGARGYGLWFWNEGAYPITIAHASSASLAANRLHLRSSADVVLQHGSGLLITGLTDWTTDPVTPMGWYEYGAHDLSNSPTTTTPSRVLGTAFQPSATRPTMVTFSASADCTITLSAGQEGRVELLVDSANPPTTVRADITGCRNTGAAIAGMNVVVGSRGTASYLVPTGDYALIRKVDVTGTPAYAITHQTEQGL
jgi:hypothetical protein